MKPLSSDRSGFFVLRRRYVMNAKAGKGAAITPSPFQVQTFVPNRVSSCILIDVDFAAVVLPSRQHFFAGPSNDQHIG
jgi:hypothetical protein